LLTWTKDPPQDGIVAFARLIVHLSLTWRATYEVEGTSRLSKHNPYKAPA
jgi:hypothetical protein